MFETPCDIVTINCDKIAAKYEFPQNVVHKNAQKNSIDFNPCIHNIVGTGEAQGRILPLLVMLGSQGIVVKCTPESRHIFAPAPAKRTNVIVELTNVVQQW